jgi:hypothetical protein
MRAPAFAAGVCDASVPVPLEMSSRRDLTSYLAGRGRFLYAECHAEHQCRSYNG